MDGTRTLLMSIAILWCCTMVEAQVVAPAVGVVVPFGTPAAVPCASPCVACRPFTAWPAGAVGWGAFYPAAPGVIAPGPGVAPLPVAAPLPPPYGLRAPYCAPPTLIVQPWPVAPFCCRCYSTAIPPPWPAH